MHVQFTAAVLVQAHATMAAYRLMGPAQGSIVGTHNSVSRQYAPTVFAPSAAPSVAEPRNTLAPKQPARGHILRAAVADAPSSASSNSSKLPWQAAMAEIKKRKDLKTIMIIGAGPIVIGQVGMNWKY